MHTCLQSGPMIPRVAAPRQRVCLGLALEICARDIIEQHLILDGKQLQQLRRAGKGYVLGVSSAHVFHSWGKRRSVAGKAADIAQTRRASDWKRLSAGAGTKGPRLHDWCYLELADLEVEEFN